MVKVLKETEQQRKAAEIALGEALDVRREFMEKYKSEVTHISDVRGRGGGQCTDFHLKCFHFV